MTNPRNIRIEIYLDNIARLYLRLGEDIFKHRINTTILHELIHCDLALADLDKIFESDQAIENSINLTVTKLTS